MAEEWYRHLGNLSWWEQIDRVFNPSKYSCSNFYQYEYLIPIFWLLVFVCVGILIGLKVLWWYQKKKGVVDG